MASASSAVPKVIDLTADEPVRVSEQPAKLRLVLLCGTIGAGKTTLSKSWCALKPGWTRVCQDELRDRASCENMCRMYLAQGQSCIVDRQNFDKQQRRYWLDIGRALGAEVIVLVMSTTYAECERRLRGRFGHESIESPAKALALLPKVAAQFRMPTDVEGFDRIVKLPRDLPLNLTVEDIDRIIVKMDAAPKQHTLDSLFKQPRTFPPAPANAWQTRPATF